MPNLPFRELAEEQAPDQEPPRKRYELACPELGEESRLYWEEWGHRQNYDHYAAAHFGTMLHKDQERLDTAFLQ